MFEDDQTMFVECPVSGASSDVTVHVLDGVARWQCPVCEDVHEAELDFGDDDSWLEEIYVGRVNCE